jgi:RNA polymerase sigma factor (sigma-70 family)
MKRFLWFWGAASPLEDDVSDARLLARFAGDQDEDAFEELFRRHGSMVLGVCRRVLGNAADAEDAFQATWLVLARKAGSLRERGSVSNWLFGVAQRTALCARRARTRRQVHEAQVPSRLQTNPDSGRELQLVLDEELARLPEKFRAVFVSCDLEGKTRCEAARALGWAEGTVASRLAKARAILARGLARHGLAPAEVPAAPALDPPLADATVQAALNVASGKAARRAGAPPADLAEGVLADMVASKTKKVVAAWTLVIAVVLGGVIFVAPGVFVVSNGKGPEAMTRAEIGGLAQAVRAFKEDFNVSYIPSQILLREDGAYNTANPIEKDTVTFLQQMFGRRVNLVGVDWNGNGAIDQGAAGTFTLTGDQCLVFFLGGIPMTNGVNGCLGFSTDPVNPSTSAGQRRGPYYEFKSGRLVRGSNGFFSYVDAFNKGSPYAYFSSYKTTNGYNRYGASDCPHLGVSPYQLPSRSFINAGGFQIISAGANGIFGVGGTTWDPTSGYPRGDPGADDLSNFSSTKLGMPQM